MQLTINYTGLHQFTINFHDQNAVKDCSKPGYPQPKKNEKPEKGRSVGGPVRTMTMTLSSYCSTVSVKNRVSFV